MKRWLMLLWLVMSPAHAELSYELLTQLTESPESLQGEFKQEKYLAEFDTTLLSSGIFNYQRNEFIRWQTKMPIENELLMKPSSIASSQGGEELISLQADKDPAAKVLTEIFFAVLTADWNALSDYFFANGDYQNNRDWEVKLTPRKPTLKQAINHVELSGDTLMRKVVLHEKNGDITRIDFLNLQQ
ncbi:MAG: outer membrane lipoprotein carrier protein LolA [Methylophaga sp.]